MYNFAKLFSLSQQQTFALYHSHIYNKNSNLPQTKHNNNTVTWRFRKRNHLPRRFRRFRETGFQIRQIDCIKPKNLIPVSARFRKSITALISTKQRASSLLWSANSTDAPTSQWGVGCHQQWHIHPSTTPLSRCLDTHRPWLTGRQSFHPDYVQQLTSHQTVWGTDYLQAHTISTHPATNQLAALIMAALCNRGAIIFLPCSFFISSSSSIYLFFSSPNLSGRRLDVYHTSTHGVALVRI